MTSVSSDTNWRVPYKDWTAIDLVIANCLRPIRLPARDLVLFGHHRLHSIHNTYRTLRHENRLFDDNTVNHEHPKNLELAGTPKYLPLPDPGFRPETRRRAAEVHQATSLAAKPADPEVRFDRQSAAQTLENWISTGAAGKDTPRFIDSWLALVGTSHGSGPPPPSTDAEIIDRLLRLLDAIPEPLVRQALSYWERHLAYRLHPGETTPGHVPDGPPPSSEAEVELRPRDL